MIGEWLTMQGFLGISWSQQRSAITSPRRMGNDGHGHASFNKIYQLSTSTQNIPKPSTTRHQMRVSVNGGTQNGWFIVEHPMNMDDLGVPRFLEPLNDLACAWLQGRNTTFDSNVAHHFILVHLVLRSCCLILTSNSGYDVEAHRKLYSSDMTGRFSNF